MGINYNKIEQDLNSIPSDYYRQQACEISICKNVEYQIIMVNI